MENSLYTVVDNHIHRTAFTTKNSKKSWTYGYHPDYDIVVISRDGTIGEIYDINGIKIALPSKPSSLQKGSNKWVAEEYPSELQKIKTVFDWNRKDNTFKSKYVDYIEQEFDRRDYGHWFMNNGKPTYITGTHYMLSLIHI